MANLALRMRLRRSTSISSGVWQPLLVGGGGLISGHDVNQNDGTILLRTDTYGGYLWNPALSVGGSNGAFQQVTTQTTIPADHFGYLPQSGPAQTSVMTGGIQEICSAPSNSNIAYMAWSGLIYKTTNRTANWTPCTPLLTSTATGTFSAGATSITVASYPVGSPTQVAAGQDQQNIAVYGITNPASIPIGEMKAGVSGTTVSLNLPLSGTVSNGDTIGFSIAMNPNAQQRYYGQKMAVDPINPNVVYYGSEQNGLFVTTDGGNTWSVVSGVPTAQGWQGNTNAYGTWPGYNIAFDFASGATGGKTNNIYVYVYQWNGAAHAGQLYVSTNAGSTWTAVTGAPTTCAHMCISKTGHFLWMTDITNGYGYRYNINTISWTQFTSAGNNWNVVAVHPTVPDLAILSNGNYFNITYNGTTATGSSITWSGSTASVFDGGQIGYLATFGGGGSQHAQFDPTVTSYPMKVFISCGQGIWTASIPSAAPATITMTCISQGTEQQVPREAVVVNNKLYLAVDDNGGMLITPGTYPSRMNSTVNNGSYLTDGFSVDWTPANSNLLVGSFYDKMHYWASPGYSTDGGTTWFPFSTWAADVDQSAFSNFGDVTATITSAATYTAGTTVITLNSMPAQIAVGQQVWDPWTGATQGFTYVKAFNNSTKQITLSQPLVGTLTSGNPLNFSMIQLTVPSTAGLTGVTTTPNGSTSILKLLIYAPNQQGGTIFGAEVTSGYYYAIVVDSTTVRLWNSPWYEGGTPIYHIAGYRYQLTADTTPLTDSRGILGAAVTGASADSKGQIVLSLASWAQNIFSGWDGVSANNNKNNNQRVNVSGVLGTTEANGTWIVEYSSKYNTVVLLGSVFTHAYTGGGDLKAAAFGGNSISIDATGNTILFQSAYNELPYYSPDFGHTWSKVLMPHFPATQVITNITWASNTLTVTTNINHNLVVGDTFSISGSSNVDGTYTCIAGTTGKTLVATKTGSGTVSTFGSIVVFLCFADYLNARTHCADRVTADTFYIWAAGNQSLYQLQGGVATLLSASGFSGSGLYGFNTRLRSVPGKAGELFMSLGGAGSGNQGHPASGLPLMKYKVGTGWFSCPNTLESHSVDIGAQAPGGSYPTVVFAGWYATSGTNYQWGIWYSQDGGNTFTLSVNYPTGSCDNPSSIACSQTQWDNWYVCMGGSSVVYNPGTSGVGTLYAPAIAVIKNDVTPDFTVDLPYGNNSSNDVQAGDILVIQYQQGAGAYANYLAHTITTAEIGGAAMALTGVTSLPQGLTNFRAQLVRGTNTSAYSNIVSATLDATPPTITSASSTTIGDGLPLAFSLTANESVTWSITGGADAAQFTLSGSTLEWVSNGVQSYSTPHDANTDNVYVVQITATDTAGNATNQTINVTVSAPVLGYIPQGVYDFGLTGYSLSGSLGGLPIGAARSDRIVFGFISSGGAMATSSSSLTVTITPNAGSPVTATVIPGVTSTSVIGWYANVPTGTSMTIAWDGDHGSATNVAMVAYGTLTGQSAGGAATPTLSGTLNGTSPFQNDPVSGTIAVPAGSTALVAAFNGAMGNSETITWTGCSTVHGDGYLSNPTGNSLSTLLNHKTTSGSFSVSGSPTGFSGGFIAWIAFATT